MKAIFNNKSLVYATSVFTLLTIVPTGAKAANWPDHVLLAGTYIQDIQANNNAYNSPAVLRYVSGVLYATTRCGSFTAALLKNAYPGELTDTKLTALTGSNSPYADQWYNAIKNQASDPASGLAFVKRTTVAAIQSGDILASIYTTSGDTGHAMTVGTIETSLTQYNIDPPNPIPGVAKVNKYVFEVFDSTKNVHGSYAGNPFPDSRYLKQYSGGVWVNDEGIGSGHIVVYGNASTGAIVAWAWNVSPTTSSFYYAVNPPTGSTYEKRPLVAGYISGL